ncbi:MAG: hypothetical protein WB949_17505 [Candidatus Acidiferrales bacterium]
MRENIRGDSCVRKISAPAALLAAIALGAIFLAGPAPLFAQDNPKYVIDEDCQAFDIAPDNSIVYAVPRIKGVKRLIIERDDIYVASGPGKSRKIVEADKFMPFPPPAGYVVNSLAWSPDGQRIAVNMTLQEPPPGWDVKNEKKKGELDESEVEPPLTGIGGGRAIALLDAEGHEIKVAGSKTRFIEGGAAATWLADGKSVVYLTGGGPYTITRVNPSDGQTTALFGGHTFNMVIWDAKKNRAFAVGDNLSIHGRLTLVQLDLLHETVTEVTQLENYQTGLSLSPSGTKVGYFEDGDWIDVVDIVHPSAPLRLRVGFGRFGWSRDERRILLKRGADDRSNILLWVGLYDGTFASILHDLQFRDFQISPDGQTIAVTIPGKRVLKVYALQ